MGADLLLAYLPAATITKKRRRILHRLVNRLTEAEVNDEELVSLSDDENVRNMLHAHIDLIPAKAWEYRDAVTIHLPHMPYPLMFTGGASWGDSPCEMFDPFCTLGMLPSILGQLRQWALEDERNWRSRRKRRRAA
jgi:hypothetical protein